ncbi:MAG: Gfo/Idh/MocA family oxidoreductase [Chloroflexi bacterium]|nr:Gfo/Idh/MocA family oxidoreductase [Chloroflexota bacterium]
MKVCLIGAGRIGQLHARTLAADPHTSELVVADADAERARVLADKVGARHAAVDEALGTADALVIAAATDAHAQLVRRGLERRVPTFCEKPLARELDETLELVSLVEDSGVPLQVGFQRRFDAGYAEARRLVASGELGVLYCVRLASHDPEPPHEAYIPTSGGLFRDLSIHDFDIIRWLTGAEVEEVYADGAVRNFEVFARYDDIDTAVATLRMSDGSLAVLTAARHDPPGCDVRAELFGSRDSISVGLGPRTPLRSVDPGVDLPPGPAWTNFLVRFEDAYRAELSAFLRVAQGELPSPCTARDGLQAMRTAVAATRSFRDHRPVKVAEVS